MKRFGCCKLYHICLDDEKRSCCDYQERCERVDFKNNANVLYIMWTADVLTLFPENFPGQLKSSVVGAALDQGKWTLNVHDMRDFAKDKHRSVDDAPFGGGSGMILKPDVVSDAIDAVCVDKTRAIICTSPRGKVFNQSAAKQLSKSSGIYIISTAFEGVDERVIEYHKILEMSVGDFILSCGDIAAIAIIDSVVRLLPLVLGNGSSLEEESFDIEDEVLLEYPQYTRPRKWKNMFVPEVLISGNHSAIRNWRLAEAKRKTAEARPDLWNAYLKKKNQ